MVKTRDLFFTFCLLLGRAGNLRFDPFSVLSLRFLRHGNTVVFYLNRTEYGDKTLE